MDAATGGTASLPAGLDPELILLDRDGVLNENLAGGVRGVADWTWVPGSVTAVRLLAAQGRRLMVVTNQAIVARRLLSTADLDVIHRHLLLDVQLADLTLADILYCPHGPQERCGCRKPEPGLVTSALTRAGVDASRALQVGDH
jgi:D-glycero-D-manno-heptose 1,7-bisphosphate phosphatase